MLGFGDDGDDGEDVDVAQGGEVGAAEQGGADADEVLPLVSVFRDLERERSDAGYDFGWGKGVPGALVSCRAPAGNGVVRGGGDRTYWSTIVTVLRSSSLMEPCSTWGRNVVSTSVSLAGLNEGMACVEYIPSAVQ